MNKYIMPSIEVRLSFLVGLVDRTTFIQVVEAVKELCVESIGANRPTKSEPVGYLSQATIDWLTAPHRGNSAVVQTSIFAGQLPLKRLVPIYVEQQTEDSQEHGNCGRSEHCDPDDDAVQQITGRPYSLDHDPAGIRALVCDAVRGAIASGAQGKNEAPEDHWLKEFWNAGKPWAPEGFCIVPIEKSHQGEKALEAEPVARWAVSADKQHRTALPVSFTEEGYQRLNSIPDGAMLYAAPQSAEPVKVPSDEEFIREIIGASQFAPAEHYVGVEKRVRAILSKYAAPQPAEPVKIPNDAEMLDIAIASGLAFRDSSGEVLCAWREDADISAYLLKNAHALLASYSKCADLGCIGRTSKKPLKHDCNEA